MELSGRALTRLIFMSVVRAAVVLAVFFPVAAATALAFYLPWKEDHVRALEAGSRVVETARGEIELATLGSGEPLLVIHGTPGGYDGALSGPRARPESFEGIRVLAISRPGYLRTPLESGRTPAEQADLYAALLDALGIDRAIVHGISGGGPSALQLALRHPQRVSGLILSVPLLSRYTGEWPAPGSSAAELLCYDVAIWLIGHRSIARGISGFDPDDSQHASMAREMARSRIPFALRADGYLNDGEQFRRLDVEAWPLESMRVPTLLVHGTADANAPYAGSARAGERLPMAELVTIEGADHYVTVTHAETVDRRIARFIAGLSRPPSAAPRRPIDIHPVSARSHPRRP